MGEAGPAAGEGSELEFDSDGEGSANDVEVEIENEYYNAKQLRDSSNEDAAASFDRVIALERQSLKRTVSEDGDDVFGPWSYKAIKQLVKLHLLGTRDSEEMLRQYQRLLKCIKSGAVGQNVYEKGITNTLERTAQVVSSSFSNVVTSNHDIDCRTEHENSRFTNKIHKETLRRMYAEALIVFEPSGPCPNDRLWFKTNLKLGQLLYEMNELEELNQVIKELLKGQQPNQDMGGEGKAKQLNEPRYAGTHMLEIYALQIQLYSRQKDHKKLRALFDRAMRVEGGIPHPRTLALIQEMGGKMHMAAREFEAAGKTFFQAFKSYDEAGDPSRLKCLKYLVMASMLHASSINPFDSQEARPYKDDPEIVAMTNLVQAFHNNDIRGFEGILQRNEGQIMDDEFVREYLSDLLRTIRTQVIQRVIMPYSRVKLEYISQELNNISIDEVESLLVSLILDKKLHAKVDQVKGILFKDAPIKAEASNLTALDQLAKSIEDRTIQVHRALITS